MLCNLITTQRSQYIMNKYTFNNINKHKEAKHVFTKNLERKVWKQC